MKNCIRLIIYVILKIKKFINIIKCSQILIELIELYNFLSEIFNAFENITNFENKENVINLKFIFCYIVNINVLEGNLKEKANHIIKIISDIDEYI